MFVLIVSPYRPQVCHEHQNSSGRREVLVNQDFQIDQSETQIETSQIYQAAQRGKHRYPMDREGGVGGVRVP